MIESFVKYVLRRAAFIQKSGYTFYRPRKTWSLDGQPDIVRVICASKNLTAAHWEAFVACEGAVQGVRLLSDE